MNSIQGKFQNNQMNDVKKYKPKMSLQNQLKGFITG